jgi:hypothetical protein
VVSARRRRSVRAREGAVLPSVTALPLTLVSLSVSSDRSATKTVECRSVASVDGRDADTRTTDRSIDEA